MKTARINKAFWPIVSTMSVSDIRNSYFGGSNLYSEFVNDYSDDGAEWVAEWFESNVNKPHMQTADGVDASEFASFIRSPDNLLRRCGVAFNSALCWMFEGNCDPAEKIMRDSPQWFDAWGDFYVYARPFSNACTQYWIIRADSEQSAFEELTTRFESDFLDEDAQAQQDDGDTLSEDTQYNDNGNPINTESLVLFGMIKEA